MVSRQLLANQIDFPRIRTPRPPEKPSPFSHNLCGPEVPEVFWRAEKLAPQQWKLFTFNESGNLSWFMTVKKNFRYSFVLHIITVCHFWLLEECQQWSSSCVVTNRVIVAPCTACKNMIFFLLAVRFWQAHAIAIFVLLNLLHWINIINGLCHTNCHIIVIVCCETKEKNPSQSLRVTAQRFQANKVK